MNFTSRAHETTTRDEIPNKPRKIDVKTLNRTCEMLVKKLQSSRKWKISRYTTMRMNKLWKSLFDFCTLCCSLLYWLKTKQTEFCNVSIIRQSIGVTGRNIRTFTLISMIHIPTLTMPKLYEHGYHVIEIKYELSVVPYKAYVDLSK